MNLLSKLRFEVRRARRTFKIAGPAGVYRGIRNAVAGAVFDLYHGVDTSALWTRYSLPQGYDGAFEYGPVKSTDLKKVLKNLQAIPHEEFVFLDIGSGKGKMLLVASCLPFKQVLGIEVSPELHQIALKNIRKFRSSRQKCRNISNLCADATSFALPPDNTVLFLYHPFRAPVMTRFLAHLEQSLADSPRELYIIYVKPVFNDLLMNTQWLTLLAMADSFAIYRHIPASMTADSIRDLVT